MAARASEDQVIAILDPQGVRAQTTTIEIEHVAPFLRAANAVVTANLLEQGYSAELLEEIERWLAAHLYSCVDPMVAEETIGDGRAKYHGKTDMGLNFTPYGQQVALLDKNGKIASVMNAKRPAVVKVIA